MKVRIWDSRSGLSHFVRDYNARSAQVQKNRKGENRKNIQVIKFSPVTICNKSSNTNCTRIRRRKAVQIKDVKMKDNEYSIVKILNGIKLDINGV